MPKRKKITKKYSSEKRRFGVILESIGSSLHRVLEGHAALGKEIKDFKEETREKFGLLKIGLDVLKEDVAVLKEDVSVLKEDVAVLKEDVAVLKEDVSVLKEDVAVLKEDVSVLKEDVAVLKKDVSVLKEDVAVLKEDVLVLKGDTTDLKSSSKQIFEYLKRIDNEIQDLKKKLDQKADLERLALLEKRVAQIELVVKKYYGKDSN
jgi:chromosome segregation ATPase